MLMKKIFTLIATAFVALSVNAQTWNFSDFEEKEYDDVTVVNGLTINAASDKKITIEENSKTVEGVTYTKRLKLGGSGSATSRNIAFTASGAGTLKLISTSSSSGTDRELGVSLDGTEVGTTPASGSGVEVGTVSISGAGTVTIYSKSSGVNLYLVEFTAGGGGGGSATGETESYLAVKEDGSAASTEFANPTASGTDLIVNVATANVTLKAVASKTPARSQTAGMTEETWDKWNDANWDGPKKQNDIQFYWMQGSGNPYISFQSKTIINNDEPTGDYDPDYTYYQPDGSMGLPKSGEYIEVTAKVDGMFKIGFWANKGGSRKLYLIDKETKKALTWDADETKTQYKVEGYVNGWDEEWVETEGETKVKKAKKRFIPYMQVNDYVLGDPAAVNDKVLDAEFNPTTKVVDQVNNAVKFGWFVFDAKANKTYMIFGSDWQFGFQGYQFTPGASISGYTPTDPTGVEAITTKSNTWNANAPMYNLSGQQVDKSYKGIVIQNGRKFVNK